MLGLTSDVKVKINSEKDCQKSISVELANSIVQEKIQKAFESIQTQAKVPGFRPGKAPIEKIRNSFKELAYERAQESLLQHGVSEAIKAKKIQPVQPPMVQNVQFSPEKSFHFEFSVEVAPEVKATNYKGLKITKNVKPLTDADLTKALDNIAQMNARLVESKDEALGATQFAIVDYEGFMDAKPIEGAKAQNFLMDMSAPQAINGLTEGLVGAKPGEERSVSVKFPDDAPSKELAGKEAVFKVKLNAIKEKKTPTLDDEFAKDLGLASLAELKSKVKENLEREKEAAGKNDLEKQIIDKLLEENTFTVPPTLVKNQEDRLLDRQKERLTSQGYGKEDAEKVVDRIKADVRKEAERQVRLAYLLDAIADQEKIVVEDSEIAARISAILTETPEKEKVAMEKALHGQYNERVRSELREEKLFKWLIEQAKIKEV